MARRRHRANERISQPDWTATRRGRGRTQQRRQRRAKAGDGRSILERHCHSAIAESADKELRAAGKTSEGEATERKFQRASETKAIPSFLLRRMRRCVRVLEQLHTRRKAGMQNRDAGRERRSGKKESETKRRNAVLTPHLHYRLWRRRQSTGIGMRSKEECVCVCVCV